MSKEQISEVQNPLQKAIVYSSVACFLCMILLNTASRTLLVPLHTSLIRWLFFIIVPILTTFVVFYRSCWYEETSLPMRILLLMLLCFNIYVGVLLGMGITLCYVWFCYNAVTGGLHP
ncbi:MAG: hypothetical protein WDN00_05550 [Limisphaerales bacterium]